MTSTPMQTLEDDFVQGLRCAICDADALHVVHLAGYPDYVHCRACEAAFVVESAGERVLYGNIPGDYPQTRQWALHQWVWLEAVARRAAQERAAGSGEGPAPALSGMDPGRETLVAKPPSLAAPQDAASEGGAGIPEQAEPLAQAEAGPAAPGSERTPPSHASGAAPQAEDHSPPDERAEPPQGTEAPPTPPYIPHDDAEPQPGGPLPEEPEAGPEAGPSPFISSGLQDVEIEPEASPRDGAIGAPWRTMQLQAEQPAEPPRKAAEVQHPAETDEATPAAESVPIRINDPPPGHRYRVVLRGEQAQIPQDVCAHCMGTPVRGRLAVVGTFPGRGEVGHRRTVTFSLPLCADCHKRASARSPEERSARVQAYLVSLLTALVLVVIGLVVGLVNFRAEPVVSAVLVGILAVVGYGIPLALLSGRISGRYPPPLDAAYVRSTLLIPLEGQEGLQTAFEWRNRQYAERFLSANLDQAIGDVTPVRDRAVLPGSET